MIHLFATEGGKPPHGSSSPNLDKTGGLVWASFYGSFCQRQRTRKEWKCYLFWLKISASKENWNYFQQVLFCKKKGLLKIWCGLSVCYCRDFFLQRRGRDGQFRFNQDWKVGRSKKGSVGHYHLRSAKEGRRYRTHVTNTRHGLWFASKSSLNCLDLKPQLEVYKARPS